MLQAIVQFSLRHRGVVLTLACLLVGYGVWVAAHAKLDVFPEFVPPQVTVQTEAPGLAPEQVETLVTRPIENAINGLGSQESLRSETIQGLSVITVVFKEGTDIQAARQLFPPEAIGEVPIVTSAGGAPVRLKDVATVAYGPEPKFGDALVMGRPGVLMTMSSQFGANTMEVTRLLEAALEDLKPLL